MNEFNLLVLEKMKLKVKLNHISVCLNKTKQQMSTLGNDIT